MKIIIHEESFDSLLACTDTHSVSIKKEVYWEDRFFNKLLVRLKEDSEEIAARTLER